VNEVGAPSVNLSRRPEKEEALGKSVFLFLLANGVCERQQLRFEKYDLALLTRIGPRGGSNV